MKTLQNDSQEKAIQNLWTCFMSLVLSGVLKKGECKLPLEKHLKPILQIRRVVIRVGKKGEFLPH